MVQKIIGGKQLSKTFKIWSHELTQKKEQQIYMTPIFCYSDNEDAPHVIGGYVQSNFKFNCPSINKRLNKLEVHLQPSKTNRNTFFPLQKDF